MLREFKPAFFFLGKFLGLYLIGNLLYGFYVESYNHQADFITENVTHQTSFFLNVCGENTSSNLNLNTPTVSLNAGDESILSVYEGCNGVNVMIVFIAFVIAFGGPLRSMIWFSVVGLLILQATNIARIALLYYTAIQYEEYFYYVHKYFFTAILYLIVFSLWSVWIVQFNVKPARKSKSV